MDDIFDLIASLCLPLGCLFLLIFMNTGGLETLINSYLSEESTVSVVEEIPVDEFTIYDFKE